MDAPTNQPPSSWRRFLGLNASTLALLGAIFLVTASTELWSPIVPQYLKPPTKEALATVDKPPGVYEPPGLARRSTHAPISAWLLLVVGGYGFLRDALEAVNYYAGGALAGWLNARRALLLFNLLPLVGFAIIGFWSSQPQLAVFCAIPFIFVWDSIAGPATITVVGDAIAPDRRTMAFSLQAIFRRVSRAIAYLISALVLSSLGDVRRGFRADLAISCALVLAAAVIQFRYMKTASRDASTAIHRPMRLFRRFPPDLKRLLAADVFARWAEGLAGPFIILYCVPLLADSAVAGTARYQSILLNIQAATNVILYLVIGPLASREGLAKKPYIGLTFLFFALFPISVAVLGSAAASTTLPTSLRVNPGGAGPIILLALAFVVGGFREIGEPARKAMIADLVPSDVKTQAIGLYWSARSAAVMWAAPVGALAWIIGDRIHPGAGPLATFTLAGMIGLVGAAVFFLRFGRAEPPMVNL